MASRSARRNRGTVARQPAKRPPANPGGVTLSGDQLTAVLAASQRASSGLAAPLPRPPQWATDPFGPGTPLRPASINRQNPRTGRAEPRLFELPISTNLNINTAPFVPWKTLSDAADMPLFRKCIERRKSICGLGFTVTVDPKAVARESQKTGQATRDVESAMRDKYMDEITRVSDWLEYPDRGNGYDWQAWASQLMENRLVYDATVVYPKYTFGGDLFSLEVVDGSTVKPLLDERGGRPLPPAPFAQQILYGFPRGEFVADTVDVGGVTMVPGGMTTDQLLYERTVIRPKTPYGMSATEIALLDGILWMKRMGWLLGEYTEGVTGALLEVAAEVDWDVAQWEDYAAAMNDKLRGDTAARLAYSLLPPGTKAVLPQEVAERYKPDMDLFLIKLVAGDFGLPASEVGFTEAGALGASFHEGEEDILNRQTRRPDAQWIGGIATRLCVRQLAMPPALTVQVLGLESEDEAAADAVAASQVSSGRATFNEDRARRGEPPYPFAEADKPMIVTPRGVVFLEGAAAAARAGEEIGPPKPVAQGAGQDGGQDDEDPGQDGEPPPASKSAELATLRKWLARHPSPARPFACKALTEADAPDLAGDPRVQLAESVVKVGPKGYIHGWIFVGAPEAGDRVFHAHHGHGTVTGAENRTVRVRFDRSGEHRSFPVHPDPHGARHLEDMSDEDLYHQLMGRGEGEHFDRAVAELDRRDHAARQQRVKQLYARQPRGDEERGQLYQQLVDEGENPEDAWAHAHGATTDELRRQAAVAQLRQQGYRGSGFDAVARSAYKDEVHRSVLDAEAATNGYLTSPEGKRKGIDGWSLFTGTEARARRYASPELREYWDQHGRLTFDDFKAMLLGHHGAQGPRGGDFYA